MALGQANLFRAEIIIKAEWNPTPFLLCISQNMPFFIGNFSLKSTRKASVYAGFRQFVLLYHIPPPDEQFLSLSYIFLLFCSASKGSPCQGSCHRR